MATSLMHHGLESAAARFPDHAGCPGRRRPLDLRRARPGQQRRWRAHLAAQGVGRGRPRRGDDVEPAGVRGGRPRRQQARGGARPAELRPGRRSRSSTAVGLTAPRYGVADGPGVGLLAEHLGADGVLDLDDAAGGRVDRPHERRAAARGRRERQRRRRLRLQLRHDRPAEGGAPHAPVHRPGDRSTGSSRSGLGHDDRFQVATPPSHILGLLNLLAAAAAGATVRLHRRFDLDEELRCIEDGAHDPRDGGRAHRAGHGQPSRPRGLRPLVAALHHVGRHARHAASVAETVTARTGVRWLPAYGTSEVPVIAANPVDDRTPGGSIPPGSPSATSRCASSTSTPARCSRPGESRRDRGQSASAMAGYLPDEATAAPSTTAGTAPATSAGSSPTAGSTSPTAARR